MRSQKCMWVNNAGQFGKGHSLSSTEINIIGVWKAAESTLGAWQRQTPRQAPGFTATALPPPVRSSLTTVFASLLQLTSWLGSRPLPLLQLETNHIYVKTTSELFPSPATPEYKTCSEWLPHSLEEFYDFVTAAQHVRLLGRGSLESLPNNEATLLLAFPFKSNKTAHVSIFRWLSSGAIDMQKPEPQARTGPAGLGSYLLPKPSGLKGKMF